MAMFLIGFGCGVVVTVIVAAVIIAKFLDGAQRGIGRALGW